MHAHGVIDDIDGDICTIDIKGKDSVEVSADQIKCDFQPVEGDFLQITYDKEQKIESIQPEEREPYIDEISQINEVYGVVGSETIFYHKSEVLNVGDTLECDRIKGDFYGDPGERYEYRCISFKKIESPAGPEDAYSSLVPANNKGNAANILKCNVDPFPMAEIRDLYDDIPYELKQLMANEKSSEVIRKKLDELFPSELNIATYKTIFHNLVYLDELNIVMEFRKYAKDEASFHPRTNHNNSENNEVSQMFQLEFEGLHELRPSIMKGLLVRTFASHKMKLFNCYFRRCFGGNA